MSKKSNLDKYYTKPSTVKLCTDLIDFRCFKTKIEPSAGNGAFIGGLKCVALDIQPEGRKGIKKADFLKYKFKSKGKIIVFGNFPFSLAIPFFQKSALIGADTIATILPCSFKKSYMQNRIPKNYHLIKQIDLPPNSFLLNGQDYHVPAIFQIWQRMDEIRVKPERVKPVAGYKWCMSADDADLSIKRVGKFAGKASANLSGSPESHLFIKLENNNKLNKQKILTYLNSIIWTHGDTVGQRSISRQQFTAILNIYFNTGNLYSGLISGNLFNQFNKPNKPNKPNQTNQTNQIKQLNLSNLVYVGVCCKNQPTLTNPYWAWRVYVVYVVYVKFKLFQKNKINKINLPN